MALPVLIHPGRLYIYQPTWSTLLATLIHWFSAPESQEHEDVWPLTKTRCSTCRLLRSIWRTDEIGWGVAVQKGVNIGLRAEVGAQGRRSASILVFSQWLQSFMIGTGHSDGPKKYEKSEDEVNQGFQSNGPMVQIILMDQGFNLHVLCSIKCLRVEDWPLIAQAAQDGDLSASNSAYHIHAGHHDYDYHHSNTKNYDECWYHQFIVIIIFNPYKGFHKCGYLRVPSNHPFW